MSKVGTKPFRKRRLREYEWEYERARLFVSISDEDLKGYVREAIAREPFDGHAYSESEIGELRDILKASSIEWPDHRLHRHTDEFAFYVGWWIRVERPNPPGERITQVKCQLLKPAKDLSDSISEHDLSREFMQPWGGYREFNIESFKKALEQFIGATNRHLQELKHTSKKGKSADSDLIRHFVYAVSMLCEVINKDFEPRRGTKRPSASKFYKVATLLWPALFQGPPRLQGAIRKFVDRWNENLRRTLAGELRLTEGSG
jgi:hypothetical protein